MELLNKRILLIDFCNFNDYPIGGYLSFAKNLMIAFGNDLALVGITTDSNDPIGKWFKKSIRGVDYDFFALTKYDINRTKYFLPDRLVCFMLLKFYKRKIFSINIKNVFIQRQEIVPAIRNCKFINVCFRFPGLENPLSISKYWYGKYLASFFDKLLFISLKNVSLILATGDEIAIDEMIERSRNSIKKESVVPFPTRINTEIFKPCNKLDARIRLNIPSGVPIIVSTGRLSWYKGWKFMIDCFSVYEKGKPGSLFYLIGEGEDLQAIEEYIDVSNLKGKINLVGKQDINRVALYLNAADLFIMGSYKEGWSTSLCEAIACGIPACVTNFSSAKSIIIEGKNGFVIDDHSIELFTQGMQNAAKIALPIDNDNVKAYAVTKLRAELLKKWQLI